MLTTSGAISPIAVSKPITAAVHSAAANHTTHNYDSATFSRSEKGSSFQMDLVSRLSQEVRTATTTADIRELHQAVSSGEYTPDPQAIACKLLFFTEEQA